MAAGHGHLPAAAVVVAAEEVRGAPVLEILARLPVDHVVVVHRHVVPVLQVARIVPNQNQHVATITYS